MLVFSLLSCAYSLLSCIYVLLSCVYAVLLMCLCTTLMCFICITLMCLCLMFMCLWENVIVSCVLLLKTSITFIGNRRYFIESVIVYCLSNSSPGLLHKLIHLKVCNNQSKCTLYSFDLTTNHATNNIMYYNQYTLYTTVTA